MRVQKKSCCYIENNENHNHNYILLSHLHAYNQSEMRDRSLPFAENFLCQIVTLELYHQYSHL